MKERENSFERSVISSNIFSRLCLPAYDYGPDFLHETSTSLLLSLLIPQARGQHRRFSAMFGKARLVSLFVDLTFFTPAKPKQPTRLQMMIPFALEE